MRQSGEPFEPSESSLKIYGCQKDWKEDKIKKELESIREDLIKAQQSHYK
jgi:hypothetical protein